MNKKWVVRQRHLVPGVDTDIVFSSWKYNLSLTGSVIITEAGRRDEYSLKIKQCENDNL